MQVLEPNYHCDWHYEHGDSHVSGAHSPENCWEVLMNDGECSMAKYISFVMRSDGSTSCQCCNEAWDPEHSRNTGEGQYFEETGSTYKCKPLGDDDIETGDDSWKDEEGDWMCKPGMVSLVLAHGRPGTTRLLSALREGDVQAVACPEGYFGTVEVHCMAGSGPIVHDSSGCTKPSDMCDEMMTSCFIGSPEMYGTPPPPCEDEKGSRWCSLVIERSLCDTPKGDKCKKSCDKCGDA
jgi:hypothetical protein